MSHFETLSKALVLSLSLLVSAAAFAQNTEGLPKGVQRIIFAEQNLLSRDLNETRIMTPKDNKQDDKYKPENGRIFPVDSYWIPARKLDAFTSEYMSPTLKKMFVKKDAIGQEFFLLLVHPESKSLYTNLTRRAEKGPAFWATSTASSRTLLMWPEERPDLAFFGKLSLNKEIGGVVRTIPQGEIARSLGTTEVLYKNKPILPKSFKFFPESLSLIPKDMARGGMIIREIPKDVANGKSRVIPLFSLYADRGDQPTVLAEMIQKSGIEPVEFVEKKIIEPFVKQWVEMVMVHGISMEPHAQNVMIGLDANNLPNGEFMHRDFGGFNLDLKNFERLKTLLPKNLPTIQGIEEDYHQRFSEASINQSLEIFFEQGFIYNLEQKMPEWVRQGWIADYRTNGRFDKKIFSKILYKTLSEEIARLTDGKIKPSTTLLKTKLSEVIEKARSQSTAVGALRCEMVFH